MKTGLKKNDKRSAFFYTICSVIPLIAATCLGWGFRQIQIPETNIVLLYILAVFTTSILTSGYVYGIVISVIATLTFNYFFTVPLYTLNVNDPSYLITFVIMTVVAFVTSTLTSKEKKNAADALEREKETKALYELTSQLTSAKDMDQVAGIAVRAVSDLLECEAACICYTETGRPENYFVRLTGNKLVREEMEDTETLYQSIKALKTSFHKGENFYDWPIYGEDKILGVVRIPKASAKVFSAAQKSFLYSLNECTALAMSRISSVRQQMKSQQEVIQERYRGNLLRAISHDLRTPLAGIMGTSEMIISMSDKQDPRYDMARGINKDAQWLHSLVENILSLTKLQEGRLTINKQYEVVEEVIGSAVERMINRAPEHEFTVKVPEDVLMVPMDGKLIMQVFINLMDNAVKHTPAGGEISVTADIIENKNQAVFTVADRGEGIDPEDLDNIFQTFYTSKVKPADSQKGIGLGLTICESIVKAHGGYICAANRTDGTGAEFTFTLPLTNKEEQLNG